jgi:hypothetical protein
MISIIIPTIRLANIPKLLGNLMENIHDVEFEILWREDVERIGAPMMVKKLTDDSKGEWVIFLGDDTLIAPYTIDNAYKFAVENDLWLVGFNDGHGQTAAHWLASKKLLDHLENREFFYTGYIHNFCDRELKVRAEKLGKFGWCENARIIHKHPAFGDKPMDDSYKVQTDKENWAHDEALFNLRNK